MQSGFAYAMRELAHKHGICKAGLYGECRRLDGYEVSGEAGMAKNKMNG